ncbi:MAG: F0F1 ATP synthase subunit A [Bowdeniella nasicola]|nr:F0F1 ATP synthase subunit A [Bowdeniella nasicola]
MWATPRRLDVQELVPLSHFASLLSVKAAALPGAAILAGDQGEFHAPSLSDFFPGPIFGEGTFFEFNRVMLIRLVATVVLCGLFILATRHMKLVPSRGQSIAELAVEFVRDNIAVEVLGKTRGRQWAPLITIIFFTVLAMNITGIIPLLNLAGTSVVGFPLVLAIVSLVAFIVAGVKAQGGWGYLKSTLFPPGVPWPIYIILTPIEFLSTFILRPATLTVRLLANMMSGHLLLALCFAATNYLLLHASTGMKPLGLLTGGVSLAFILFEVFVAVLQAYIFALLTAVYISLSVEAH